MQGCIWAAVPNATPKSRAKAKQYVVCRIGSEERDYVISYCFVQEKIKSPEAHQQPEREPHEANRFLQTPRQ